MKSKHVLLGFLLMNLMAFVATTKGTTYELSVSEGDAFHYMFLYSNAIKYDDLTNTLTVYSIDESSGYWTIKLKGENLLFTLTPLPKSPDVGHSFSYFCPTPVSSYLAELAELWNAEGNVATASGYSFSLEDAGYLYEYTFDPTTGWTTHGKRSKDGKIITEYIGEPVAGIPGFMPPLMFASAIIATATLLISKRYGITA